MRVGLKWLRELVEVDVPVEKLAERLSFSGTKVETIRKPQAVEGVIVAEVVAVEPHPNADNLVLVDVRTGTDEPGRVVCGARNFALGDRVPFATVGAHLGSDGGMQITERRIRGEVSRGMLCSAAELGVSKDHSGILVLSRDAELGTDVRSLLDLDDTILELEVTPNRPDCLGVLGVAREVAALLGNELRVPEVKVPSSEHVDGRVRVDIEDPQGCPRYVARYVQGVGVGPSPSWMSARLLASGVRPISNVVDVTNYVLLELGHPLHAFDAARVHDRRIVVRRAHKAERMRTLDGAERDLDRDDLLIADPRRALALAGVIGGKDSEVSDATVELIVESAYFDPKTIAFAARRHLLRTEASARFERGMDPEIPPFAAARAVQLITEVAGGRAAEGAVDIYPAPRARTRIELRPQRASALLGVDVPATRQAELLASIGLTVGESAGHLDVEVPGFRGDLRQEVDLVEEVARLGGLERLPATLPPGRTGGLEPGQAHERRLRRVLAGLGLHEAWTRSFASDGELDKLGLEPDHPARRMVRVANPTSEYEAAIRTTLLPGLLASVARNFAHRADGVSLFEIARVYEPTDDPLAREALVLGIVWSGARRAAGWRDPVRTWDLWAAKGLLEASLAALSLEGIEFAPSSGMPFHPTRAATISVEETGIGAFGELHPDVCTRFDIPEGTVAAEVALAPVFAALPGRPRSDELPRFPATFLDLAVVVEDGVPARAVRDAIVAAGAPDVTSVRLFDLYTGDQVPSGHKSLAYALELRSSQRTLTDDDAGAVRARIVERLETEVGGRLRA
ncbi:MAG: phenylalanine--tRNA ligase subunit beta [Actinomycetota bacterium]